MNPKIDLSNFSNTGPTTLRLQAKQILDTGVDGLYNETAVKSSDNVEWTTEAVGASEIASNSILRSGWTS